jgi:hypothetical protein
VFLQNDWHLIISGYTCYYIEHINS